MRRRPQSLRRLAALPLALAVGLFGIGLGFDLVGPTPPVAGAGGLIGNPFGGPGERCGAITELYLPGGGWVGCTHGPDPAPDGVDFRVPQPPAAPGRSSARRDPRRRTPSGGGRSERCYGDGQDGPRYRPSTPSRPTGLTATASSCRPSGSGPPRPTPCSSRATPTGGTRRVRFVTDKNCDLIVSASRSPAGTTPWT